MSQLTEQILRLADREAIRAVSFVAGQLLQQVQQVPGVPLELKQTITDDQAADLLNEAFADIASSVQYARPTASEDKRAEIARNLLVYLSEDERYASKVQDAIDQLPFQFEPVTAMAIAAGIVFLLSLDFDVGSETVNGKRKFHWRVSKKASPASIVKKILSFGAAS